MLENKILIVIAVVMLVIGSLMITASIPLRNIDCPPTDTITPTITSSSTPITPTNTPTDTPFNPTEPPILTKTPTPTLRMTVTPTNTPTDIPSPTFTLPPPYQSPTPTSTDAETPTNTVTQPPNTPMPTATPVTYTPTPTVTTIPTSTPAPTETPYPPMAADANSGIQNYLGKRLGVMQVDSVSYQLYQGSNKNGGSLLLPGGSIRGAAIYNNTIWLHRMWADGWLSISLGSHISILYTNGKIYNYTVVNVFNKSYGTYFDGDLNIASCYSDDDGNWAGISLYQLKLVNSYYLDKRR